MAVVEDVDVGWRIPCAVASRASPCVAAVSTDGTALHTHTAGTPSRSRPGRWRHQDCQRGGPSSKSADLSGFDGSELESMAATGAGATAPRSAAPSSTSAVLIRVRDLRYDGGAFCGALQGAETAHDGRPRSRASPRSSAVCSAAAVVFTGEVDKILLRRRHARPSTSGSGWAGNASGLLGQQADLRATTRAEKISEVAVNR